MWQQQDRPAPQQNEQSLAEMPQLTPIIIVEFYLLPKKHGRNDKKDGDESWTQPPKPILQGLCRIIERPSMNTHDAYAANELEQVKIRIIFLFHIKYVSIR